MLAQSPEVSKGGKLHHLRSGDYRIFYTFEQPYISLLALRRHADNTYNEDHDSEFYRRTTQNTRKIVIMTNVAHHYEQLLAEHYTWMFGSFEEKVAEQRTLFEHWGIHANGSQTALDLGSGSGFQSIALADLGFRVTAIDLSQHLLAELAERKEERAIVPLQGDIRNVLRLVDAPVDVVVCMGDTLPHLESKDDLIRLLRDIHQLLAADGQCILSFRDLSIEQHALDRFIPVRSDNNTIMTCFLEYEPENVVVHDLIYTRQGEQWTLHKSSYRKLRLAIPWLVAQLQLVGFALDVQESHRGMWFLTIRKKGSDPIKG